MVKASEKTLEYIEQYRKENVRQTLVKVNKKTEPELYD